MRNVLSNETVEYIKSDLFKKWVEGSLWHKIFWCAPKGHQQELSDWLLENDLDWIEEAPSSDLQLFLLQRNEFSVELLMEIETELDERGEFYVKFDENYKK